MKKFLFILLLSASLILIVGCKGAVEQPTAIPLTPTSNQTTQIEKTEVVEPTPLEEITSTDAVQATDIPETSTPEPSPTQDTRPLPEDWQNWPVIPTLSPQMIEVYQQGLAMRNRENAFSKVGDCLLIPEVFLGDFDDPNYVLPARMEHLQGTLDLFQGSFAREGYSLKGGFVFPTVFSPLRADSSVCNPGETPFECELRVHQPSFVLIAMEFRYEGRTAETHENYLRKAVEYALSRGVVPILSTKADNFEGGHFLNIKTVEIAYEYDLPLMNYWRAVQHLPNHGIGKEPNAFHTTPEAWLTRSETFLAVLDTLYHQAQGIQ